MLSVIASPKILLIVTVSAAYHRIIGILNVTNAFQNTLKASSYHDIINCPPHYISWFKLCFPAIHIEPAPNGRYVMEFFAASKELSPMAVSRTTLYTLSSYIYDLSSMS